MDYQLDKNRINQLIFVRFAMSNKWKFIKKKMIENNQRQQKATKKMVSLIIHYILLK